MSIRFQLVLSDKVRTHRLFKDIEKYIKLRFDIAEKCVSWNKRYPF